MTKTAAKVNSDFIDMVTELIKALVRTSENPRGVMVGVHNAFVHGEILDEAGIDCSEKDLEDLFEGFDKSIKALSHMED